MRTRSTNSLAGEAEPLENIALEVPLSPATQDLPSSPPPTLPTTLNKRLAKLRPRPAASKSPAQLPALAGNEQKKRRRRTQTCNQCQKSKRACNKLQPCQNCVARKIDCSREAIFVDSDLTPKPDPVALQAELQKKQAVDAELKANHADIARLRWEADLLARVLRLTPDEYKAFKLEAVQRANGTKMDPIKLPPLFTSTKRPRPEYDAYDDEPLHPLAPKVARQNVYPLPPSQSVHDSSSLIAQIPFRPRSQAVPVHPNPVPPDRRNLRSLYRRHSDPGLARIQALRYLPPPPFLSSYYGR